MRNYESIALVVLFALGLSSCATSPTGRKQLLLMPDGQMDSMGVQAFDEMKKKTKASTNPAHAKYVNCVVQPILRAAQGQTSVAQWEIVVFEDSSANAFALPGGKIGVHTGILPVAKTPGQLAAVLGHEVGHVIAKHGSERVSEQLAAQSGLILAGALTSESKNGQLLMAALGVGAQVGLLLPHSRTQESEADQIGLDLMARAGFDPRESVELWKNMKAASGGKAPPEFLSTHPSGDTRIERLQAGIPDVMKYYQADRAAQLNRDCEPPR